MKSLQRDQSKDTKFNPPLLSLVNTFNNIIDKPAMRVMDCELCKCFLLSALLCAENAFDGTEERMGYASSLEEAAVGGRGAKRPPSNEGLKCWHSEEAHSEEARSAAGIHYLTILLR